MRLDRELTCAQVVELVTAYLEQRLPEADTERFEGAPRVLRRLLDVPRPDARDDRDGGALRREDVPAAPNDQLLATFREARSP